MRKKQLKRKKKGKFAWGMTSDGCQPGMKSDGTIAMSGIIEMSASTGAD
jgi:hypothetical protein